MVWPFLHNFTYIIYLSTLIFQYLLLHKLYIVCAGKSKVHYSLLNFDLTCDIIGYAEVYQIRLRSTNFAELSNSV